MTTTYHDNHTFFTTGDTWHGEKLEPGWYHLDETGANWYGPFETQELAAQGLALYCKNVLGVNAGDRP